MCLRLVRDMNEHVGVKSKVQLVTARSCLDDGAAARTLCGQCRCLVKVVPGEAYPPYILDGNLRTHAADLSNTRQHQRRQIGSSNAH
jgi:hypothetical protein